ncbi:MAG: Mu transposase C-terminal domain-containing protein [Methylocella sp.]|jgi:putative transposase
MNATEPDHEDTVLWEEACRREDAIRKYVQHRTDRSNKPSIKNLCQDLGLSRATAYRMIELFRTGCTVTSLMAKSPGRPRGHRALDSKREDLIQKTIKTFYLKPTKPPVARLVHEIRMRCVALGLPAPNWRTVKARLVDLDVRAKARKRGEVALLKSAIAVPGEYRASRPLEIVQIDHTKVDIIVVDEQTREPLGRPWITLAMDIFTRMVTGFYLTMDDPSRLSVGLCLLHAVFDKSAWLQEREIDNAWPVAGLPESLHADNGADFRSKAFIRACRDEGIKTIWRPPGTPHFGGHIERLIGTQMGAVHLLPGTTQSNPSERGDYDSSKHSSLTLRELERFIALEITGQYHQMIHGALRRPPIAVWREHEGATPLRLPQDRMRFWISFLPEEERTLRPDGIHLFRLRYWSPALTADVGQAKDKLLVKYDPRDLSRVFVRRPAGTFVEARYADVTLPSITLREAMAAQKALNAKGRREIDMRTIVRTAAAQRQLVENAKRATLAVRRGMRQLDGGAASTEEYDSLRGVDSRTPIPFVEDTG